MIQSRAAWQTKLASTMLFDKIIAEGDQWNVKMNVQIHDAIEIETNSLPLAKKYRKILEKCMKEAAEFIVPHDRVEFEAEAFIGYDSWDVKNEYIFEEFLPKYEFTRENGVKVIRNLPSAKMYKNIKGLFKKLNEETDEKKKQKVTDTIKRSYGDYIEETSPIREFLHLESWTSPNGEIIKIRKL